MADRKTPPCNLGTAKFSSMKAETVLDLVAPELTRNRRLDRRVRAKPTEANISIEQGTSVERSNKELILTRQHWFRQDLNHFLMLETARAVEIGTDDIGNEHFFGMTMPGP